MPTIRPTRDTVDSFIPPKRSSGSLPLPEELFKHFAVERLRFWRCELSVFHSHHHLTVDRCEAPRRKQLHFSSRCALESVMATALEKRDVTQCECPKPRRLKRNKTRRSPTNCGWRDAFAMDHRKRIYFGRSASTPPSA